MSVIQRIRDKAAWIVFGAIALALIAFIVQDGLRSKNLFGSSSNTLGTINGEKVEATAFEEKYRQLEEQYRTAGYLNDMVRQNIRESIWNQYIEDNVLDKEYSKLGLDVPDHELGDILYGANPPEDLRRRFSDPKTGIYDPNAAYQAIEQVKKKKNSPEHKVFNDYLLNLVKTRLREKYVSLLSNSVYVPKWLVEKANTESSQKAAVSYVVVPYHTVPDTTVKVSDEEVKEYVNKHKEEFKQEKARGVEYVAFNAAPTHADSAAILNQLVTAKSEFEKLPATGIQDFLARNGSETNFFDGFVPKSKLQMAKADTIRQLADGAVYGPYLDGANFAVAKMLEKKTIPDSIFCRHILIATAGESAKPDSVAKKKIDSVVTAINGGADFIKLMQQVSDDKGANSLEGGIMKYDIMTVQDKDRFDQDFAKFIMDGNVGEKKIVKTKFGYHYIWITDKKGSGPGIKVAYLAKAILPSEETTNTAMGLASQFAAENRNLAQFDESARKKNLNKFNAADIKPMDNSVVGLGSARELVQWMFRDASVGDVADRPFLVGDKYIVPVLTQAFEEGTMSVPMARPLVEYKIRNDKKADIIVKKLGTASSLDAYAKNGGVAVNRADSVFFSSPAIPNVGREMKVVGAAFNKNNLSKPSQPIAGEMGVFIIQTDNISAISGANMDVKQQQGFMTQQQQNMNQQAAIDIMRKSANIKDNRYKFF